MDTSFAIVEKPEDKGKGAPAKSSGGLDVSFATTEDIKPQPKGKPSIKEQLGDYISGAGKNPENLGEITDYGQSAGKELKIAAGLLASLSPEGQADIVRSNIPGAKVEKDTSGNWVVEIDGQRGLINKPGLSPNDGTQFAAQMLAFIPTAKMATFATGLLGRMGISATGAGATSVAMDKVAQGAGSDQPVDKLNATLSAGFGAGAELLAPLLPTLKPVMGRISQALKGRGVTDKTRDFVKSQFIKVGLSADDATDDVIREISRLSDDAVKPEQAMALQGEKEFGIPLTKGQRSLDDAALSFEDRSRAGMLGDKPQGIIRGFEQDVQSPAIDKAKNKVVDMIAPGADDVVRPASAGAMVKESIRSAEKAADDIVGEAYANVGDATLNAESVNSLYNATRKAVIGIDKDRSLKGTAGILAQLKRSQKLMSELEKAGAKPKGKHIKELEMLRRRLNGAIGTAENPTDKRQLTQIKRAFDDFTDNAVIDGLFSGDPTALESMKSARGLMTEYAKKFRSQPIKTKSGRTLADTEGAFIEKIIAADPTDEQVINSLFGASNLSNTAGAKMAQRFKSILGEGDAWNAVRKAGLLRIIKTNTVNGKQVVSGQKTLKAINEAMEKNGSLMSELYSPEEIGVIRRFAAQVKRTQPDLVKSRENPSGTAQALSKTAGDLVRRLPLLTGDLTLSAAAGGIQVAKGAKGAAGARDAIRPFTIENTKIPAKAAIIQGGREAVN